MAGLFNRIKNKLTGKRFLVSTIKKDDNTYETAVFPANFFYLPQGFKLTNPRLVKQSRDPEEADRIHHTLSQRLQTEFPERLFQEISET
jgi:c-di-GMP-related signal transduction protein